MKMTHRILVATSCSRSARSFLALCDQYMIGTEATAADADSCSANFVRGRLLKLVMNCWKNLRWLAIIFCFFNILLAAYALKMENEMRFMFKTLSYCTQKEFWRDNCIALQFRSSDGMHEVRAADC